MSNEVKKDNTPGLPKSPDSDQERPFDDREIARQEALAEEIMRDDHEVLRKLAE